MPGTYQALLLLLQLLLINILLITYWLKKKKKGASVDRHLVEDGRREGGIFK